MSRIGKRPVSIPSNVKIAISEEQIDVSGPLGKLSQKLFNSVEVKYENNQILLSPKSDTTEAKSKWGLLRTLIENLVIGVSSGYKEILEISGVGFRAAILNNHLVMQLGFSHPIIFKFPKDIIITCPKPTQIEVSGFCKQKVNYVASIIRGFRKPEPYKGKGIRYANEVIIRKEGKKK